jgi:transcriptional regulator with XRE-family HTH domain
MPALDYRQVTLSPDEVAWLRRLLEDLAADADGGHVGREDEPDKEPLTLATWLRGELERRRWSRRKLAERVGTSASRVHDWATGARMPSPENCVRLADALDAGVDYVLMLALHRPLQWHDDDDAALAAVVTLARRVALRGEKWPERAQTLRAVLEEWDRIDKAEAAAAPATSAPPHPGSPPRRAGP